MGIPCQCYWTTSPVVEAAISRATVIVSDWLDHGQYAGMEAQARDLVQGWCGIHLIEGIASAILDAQGYDLDELTEMLDAGPSRHMTDGDAIAEWETRARRQGAQEIPGMGETTPTKLQR